MDMSLSVRQQWRQAKSYWTAALASGRVAWAEQRWTRQERQRQKRRQELKKQRQRKRITDADDADVMYGMPGQPELGEIYPDYQDNTHDMENEVIVDDNDGETIDYSEDDEDEIKELERLKAQQALLQSMQVEALWKVSKIDLDFTVQEACRMVLEGNHFLFPSSTYHHAILDDNGHLKSHGDGWIASRSGETIYADVARLRAAAAMVMYGDLMVHCSKQGTSWKE